MLVLTSHRVTALDFPWPLHEKHNNQEQRPQYQSKAYELRTELQENKPHHHCPGRMPEVAPLQEPTATMHIHHADKREGRAKHLEHAHHSALKQRKADKVHEAERKDIHH